CAHWRHLVLRCALGKRSRQHFRRAVRVQPQHPVRGVEQTMIRKNPSGDLPLIAESAYVDKTAIICGKVVIGENVFVGPYAVIRADEVDDSGTMEPITIGANSN